MPVAPSIVYLPRRRARRQQLGAFGLIPVLPISQMVPYRFRFRWRNGNGIGPYYPPMPIGPDRPDLPGGTMTTAGTPPSTSPVPASYPLNQIFMAPDGSQWVYSFSQKRWVNVGVPYNLSPGPAPPPTSTNIPSATGPPTVSAQPVEAPAQPSYWQSLVDIATKDSLISGLPNWIVAALLYGGYKFLEARAASRGH